jgi:hypothetical protein
MEVEIATRSRGGYNVTRGEVVGVGGGFLEEILITSPFLE